MLGIDPAGLAGAIAWLMGLKGKPQAVVADRFWRLGRTSWPPGSGQTREVVLAMRMHEDDASEARSISRALSSLIATVCVGISRRSSDGLRG